MPCIIYKLNTSEFYRTLDTYLENRDVSGAFNYMREMLEKSEQSKDTAGVISICNELGGLYRVTGDLDEAARYHERVINCMEGDNMQDSEHYATATMNLADVFIAMKKPEKALPLFIKTRDAFWGKGLHKDYRMAALYNNISHAYRDTGDFESAYDAIQSALDIIRTMPDKRDDLATTYVNLGELRLKQENLSEALDSFKLAQNIFLENEGRSMHYSTAMAGLGQVYFLMENYAKSVESYEQALSFIERDHGKTPYYNLIEKNLNSAKEKLS